MTKHLGVLVATAALAANGAPAVNQALSGGQVRRLAHDYYDGDAAQNDTVSLGIFRWETIIDPTSLIEFDDFGTGVNLDVGDATNPDGLIDGQDVSTAAGSVSLLKSVAIEDRRKPLWAMLGHASLAAAQAVAERCELLATFVDGNPASGTLAWTIYGSPQ